MLATNRKQTKETWLVEATLRAEFPTVECYRYNLGAIRVRIVDPRFAGLSPREREQLVMPLFQKLPENTRLDVTMLLLITASEQAGSSANLEFDDPSPSSWR